MLFILYLVSSVLSTTTSWFSVTKANDGIHYSEDSSDKDKFMVTAQYDSLGAGTNLEKLDITVNKNEFSPESCYCIGLAEGYLLADEIWDSHVNRLNAFLKLSNSEQLNETAHKFAENNLNYTAQSINDNPDDEYWKYVSVFYEQFKGMLAGYQERMSRSGVTTKNLTETDLWLLQLFGEQHDLIPFLTKQGYSGIDVKNHWMTAGSALTMVYLRHTGNRELFMGHNGYDSYSSLRRVSKRISYVLPPTSKEEAPKRTVVAFTTTPGCIASSDEFYITDNQLAVASVKMISFKDEMYTGAGITEKGVPGWLRAMTANVAATDAKKWIQTSTLHSTLTDTKTTLIVDYSKFDDSTSHMENMVPADTLTVLETYPVKASDGSDGNAYHTEDVSEAVRKEKHLLIQNTPYSSDTYTALGYSTIVGDETAKFYLDRTESTRMKEIAHSFHDNVTDMVTLKDYLRYNAYKSEDSAVLSASKVHDPCAQFGVHCELRNKDDGLTPLSFGVVSTAIVSKHSMHWNNFAVAAGAAPIEKTDALSVSDMSSHAAFSSQGIPSKMMGMNYDMMAMNGERQSVIRIIMLVLLIISSTLALTGIIITTVFCIRRYIKKKRESRGERYTSLP